MRLITLATNSLPGRHTTEQAVGMSKTSVRLLFAFLAMPMVAQTLGTPPRVSNNFDVMLQQGGVMDIHTMEELDRKRHDQLETHSEATVSRFDLKAPGKARSELNKGLQFLTRKDFQNAINSFSKAIALYPEFVAARNAMGCTYFNL